MCSRLIERGNGMHRSIRLRDMKKNVAMADDVCRHQRYAQLCNSRRCGRIVRGRLSTLTRKRYLSMQYCTSTNVDVLTHAYTYSSLNRESICVTLTQIFSQITQILTF